MARAEGPPRKASLDPPPERVVHAIRLKRVRVMEKVSPAEDVPEVFTPQTEKVKTRPERLPCQRCGGEKKVLEVHIVGDGIVMRKQVTCPRCNGTGKEQVQTTQEDQT